MEKEPNHNQIIKWVVILTSFTEDCSLDDDSMVLATAVAVDCSDAEEVKALVDDDDDEEEVCCVLCATLSVTVCKSMEQQPQRLSRNRHT